MNKKNVGVIGSGKWGKKIIKELKHLANIKFIYNSNDNYKFFNNKVDWVFVLTPNIHHFKMVKFFLKKKINTFCEKPLSLELKSVKDLIILSKKLNIKLYVNDIDTYKKKSIKINKIDNSIVRIKKDKGTAKSLLYRLAYHDFYLLSKFIKIEKIKDIEVNIKIKILTIKIVLNNNQIFNFFYSIKSNVKKHFINNTNFNDYKNNPIRDMLKFVLNKNHRFKKNNDDALKCTILIDMINKKINKLYKE